MLQFRLKMIFLKISVSVLPLMDTKIAVCPAEGCVARVPLAYVLLGHMLMSSPVFDCVSPNLRSQQASGPFVNVILFMDQQTVRPALSRSLFDRNKLLF